MNINVTDSHPSCSTCAFLVLTSDAAREKAE
jgi:hypothetical protein